MKIKRVIYLNSLSDLDMSNVGCHWTANMKYRHAGGGSNGLTPKEARFHVEITANVDDCDVNQEASWLSNEDHPSEKEVVVEKNTTLEGKMTVTENQEGVSFVSAAKKVSVNTGTRCDKWAEKYL